MHAEAASADGGRAAAKPTRRQQANCSRCYRSMQKQVKRQQQQRSSSKSSSSSKSISSSSGKERSSSSSWRSPPS
ncbi:hypothetical protein ACSSS7_006688 [Eimeria intestinalis]